MSNISGRTTHGYVDSGYTGLRQVQLGTTEYTSAIIVMLRVKPHLPLLGRAIRLTKRSMNNMYTNLEQIQTFVFTLLRSISSILHIVVVIGHNEGSAFLLGLQFFLHLRLEVRPFKGHGLHGMLDSEDGETSK